MARVRNSIRPRRDDRRGFTVIELLVVVSVIAVLISILMPTLSKSRAQAANVACKSNLRQIGLLLATYAYQWNDHYPDKMTTGAYSFRRAPGEITDPALPKPEVFGLQAALDPNFTGDPTKPPGVWQTSNTKLWICPVANDLMKSYKNTYAFSIAANLNTLNSIERANFLPVKAGPMVWDNFNLYPGTTGFQGPFGTGFTITNTKLQNYPHEFEAKKAVNFLYLDNSIDMQGY